MDKQSVLIGMSGGVDSSFTAALLQQQGYAVTGVMLQLWTDPGQGAENKCCSIGSQAIARRVAGQLDIPFYVIDAKEVFKQQVVDPFLEAYSSGRTPNPCVMCNATVRWQYLLRTADRLGIEWIATGHYARLFRREGVLVQLARGKDPAKDQSYALSMVDQTALGRTLLPLGDWTKGEVREQSAKAGLPNASRGDSQDLCFLGGGDYRDFLRRYDSRGLEPGAIVDPSGREIGRHLGLALYTLGQRKGLRIASPHPYYVTGKVAERNELVVSTTPDNRAGLFRVGQVNWLTGERPFGELSCSAQVRYRSEPFPVLVVPGEEEIVSVSYAADHAPVIVPGQVAAFYEGEVCLGGGIII